MLVRESINEMIKHLSPKTEKEVRKSIKHTEPKEKFLEGCENGFLWVIKDALKEVPDLIKYASEGIAWAALNNHLEIIEFLSQYPINDMFYTKYALCVAIAYGYLDITKYLIEKLQFNPAASLSKEIEFENDNGESNISIITALLNKHIDTVEYLLQFKDVKNELSTEQKIRICKNSHISLSFFGISWDDVYGF